LHGLVGGAHCGCLSVIHPSVLPATDFVIARRGGWVVGYAAISAAWAAFDKNKARLS